MDFGQDERGGLQQGQHPLNPLISAVPGVLGSLARLLVPGATIKLPPTTHTIGFQTVPEPPGKAPKPGEPGFDPDPGFSVYPVPSPAIPFPNFDPVDSDSAIKLPTREPDFFTPGLQKPLHKPGFFSDMPFAHDWLHREDDPAQLKPKPASDSSYPHGEDPLVRYRNATTGPESTPDWKTTDPRQSGSGPAKASRFVDPRTGKFDYWGWLDAGMANLGKGGTLFEDDTPDVMEKNAVLDKPAAMIAAGAPENARMPDETGFDTAKAGRDAELITPVVQRAAEQTQAREQDGQQAGPQAQAQPPQGQTQTQPQEQPTPQAQGASGGRMVWDGTKLVWQPGTVQAEQGPGHGQGTESNTPGSSEQGNQQSEIPGLSADPATLKSFWGSALGPKQHKVANPSAPEDYNYPNVPEPKDPEVKELIVSIAKKYGVPPELMLIKGYNESRFDQSRVSDVGAVGMFQVLPSTAKKYGAAPQTLEGNIEAATQYMRELLDKANGNPVLAEAGYFGGDPLITNGKPFGPKTMDHVKKLLPGVDNGVLNTRYPDDFASNPYTFWKYMYPYKK